MKRQRIYVDTSVIGGCFDREFAPWSKGLMRDFPEGHFLPVISEAVAAEVAAAPAFVQQCRELKNETAEGGDRFAAPRPGSAPGWRS